MIQPLKDHAAAIVLSTLILGHSVTLPDADGDWQIYRIRDDRVEHRRKTLLGDVWIDCDLTVTELLQSVKLLAYSVISAMAASNQVGLFYSDPELLAFLTRGPDKDSEENDSENTS